MRELDEIPTPIVNDNPARAKVVLVEGRWHVAWMIGRTIELTGVSYEKPRDAAQASIYLNGRFQ